MVIFNFPLPQQTRAYDRQGDASAVACYGNSLFWIPLHNPLSMYPKIFTFDLFDTLITRTVPFPEDLFPVIAGRLAFAGLWSGKQGNFSEIRIAADKLTRRRLKVEEITLQQIYDSIAPEAGWNPQQAQQAMLIEEETEISSVRPILAMRMQWEAIVSSAKAIVSDTYFSAEVIRQMLKRCDIQCDDDHLFLSSTFGMRKSTGNLYRLVAKSLGVAPDLIHHIGDNEHSDLHAAKKEGLSAELYKGSLAHRLERPLQEASSPFSSRVPGAIRLARLSFPGGNERERSIWEIGTMVAGPILFSYVSWILHTARRRGLDRLYFLARDGQIMLRVAQKIDPEFDSRYLLASRQAWHLPSIGSAIDGKSLSWMLDCYATSSLRNVLSRVGIQPEEIGALLREHGLAPAVWDYPVSNLNQLATLFANESLVSLIIHRAGEARNTVTSYLRDEGAFDFDSVGIVDLGWHGRLQQSLFRLMKESSPDRDHQIDGFYLSLKKGERTDDSGRYNSYWKPSIAKSAPHAMLLELFCSADHGGLLKFVWNETGQANPILAHAKDEAVLAWGLPLLQRAILETVSQLLAASEETGLQAAVIADLLKAPSQQVLDSFVKRPTPIEAEVFGSFPFTFDQHHEVVIQLAPAMKTPQVLAMMLPARFRPKQRTLWIPGTIMRSMGHLTGILLRIFGWRDVIVRLFQPS